MGSLQQHLDRELLEGLGEGGGAMWGHCSQTGWNSPSARSLSSRSSTLEGRFQRNERAQRVSRGERVCLPFRANLLLCGRVVRGQSQMAPGGRVTGEKEGSVGGEELTDLGRQKDDICVE